MAFGLAQIRILRQALVILRISSLYLYGKCPMVGGMQNPARSAETETRLLRLLGSDGVRGDGGSVATAGALRFLAYFLVFSLLTSYLLCNLRHLSLQPVRILGPRPGKTNPMLHTFQVLPDFCAERFLNDRRIPKNLLHDPLGPARGE